MNELEAQRLLGVREEVTRKTQGIAYITTGAMLLVAATLYSLNKGIKNPSMDVKLLIFLGPMFVFLILFYGIDLYTNED